MSGSDWPVCLLASDYARVLELAGSLATGLSTALEVAVTPTRADSRGRRLKHGLPSASGS